MKLKLFAAFLLFLWKTDLFAYEWEVELLKDSLLPAAHIEIVNTIHSSALERKFRKVYRSVPSVYEIHLPRAEPMRISNDFFFKQVGPGISSVIIEEARFLSLYDDFKVLVDLQRKSLTYAEWRKIVDQTEASVKIACEQIRQCTARERREMFVKDYIGKVYDFRSDLVKVDAPEARPQWRLRSEDRLIADAFTYTEEHWEKLLRHHTSEIAGSLLPSPYPFLMPAGRFTESYYWDTYFGVEGLLVTGRLQLAQMQAENLLDNLHHYGKIPNGQREYYLTRSQPPFSSSLVRRVIEETFRANAHDPIEKKRVLRWLEKRAFPLLERELMDFWMDALTRYDVDTGLHHHWDELNVPRPERHSSDDEVALGLQYRDVRAVAETGLDFTAAFEGESGKNEASEVANVLLNSMIYKFIRDLVWMADLLADRAKVEAYEKMAERKKEAIHKYLWSEADGFFQSYHLRARKRLSFLTANTFAPLFAGAATPQQAERLLPVLKKLEFDGGVAASELYSSHHQWDSTNGWAPLHMMTIDGLLRYGFKDDAKRIARKWVHAIAEVYKQEGAFFERIDIKKIGKPRDDPHKYPVQEGFLWTNASYVWALFKVLGYEKNELAAF